MKLFVKLRGLLVLLLVVAVEVANSGELCPLLIFFPEMILKSWNNSTTHDGPSTNGLDEVGGDVVISTASHPFMSPPVSHILYSALDKPIHSNRTSSTDLDSPLGHSAGLYSLHSRFFGQGYLAFVLFSFLSIICGLLRESILALKLKRAMSVNSVVIPPRSQRLESVTASSWVSSTPATGTTISSTRLNFNATITIDLGTEAPTASALKEACESFECTLAKWATERLPCHIPSVSSGESDVQGNSKAYHLKATVSAEPAMQGKSETGIHVAPLVQSPIPAPGSAVGLSTGKLPLRSDTRGCPSFMLAAIVSHPPSAREPILESVLPLSLARVAPSSDTSTPHDASGLGSSEPLLTEEVGTIKHADATFEENLAPQAENDIPQLLKTNPLLTATTPNCIRTPSETLIADINISALSTNTSIGVELITRPIPEGLIASKAPPSLFSAATSGVKIPLLPPMPPPSSGHSVPLLLSNSSPESDPAFTLEVGASAGTPTITRDIVDSELSSGSIDLSLGNASLIMDISLEGSLIRKTGAVDIDGDVSWEGRMIMDGVADTSSESIRIPLNDESLLLDMSFPDMTTDSIDIPLGDQSLLLDSSLPDISSESIDIPLNDGSLLLNISLPDTTSESIDIPLGDHSLLLNTPFPDVDSESIDVSLGDGSQFLDAALPNTSCCSIDTWFADGSLLLDTSFNASLIGSLDVGDDGYVPPWSEVVAGRKPSARFNASKGTPLPAAVDRAQNSLDPDLSLEEFNVAVGDESFLLDSTFETSLMGRNVPGDEGTVLEWNHVAGNLRNDESFGPDLSQLITTSGTMILDTSLSGVMDVSTSFDSQPEASAMDIPGATDMVYTSCSENEDQESSVSPPFGDAEVDVSSSLADISNTTPPISAAQASSPKVAARKRSLRNPPARVVTKVRTRVAAAGTKTGPPKGPAKENLPPCSLTSSMTHGVSPVSLFKSAGSPKGEARSKSLGASSAITATLTTAAGRSKYKAAIYMELADVDAEMFVSDSRTKAVLESITGFFYGGESDLNWPGREASIVRLRGLVKGDIHLHWKEGWFGYVKDTLMRPVDGYLVKAVQTGRTSLARNTCSLIQEIAIAMGPLFGDKLLRGIIHPLLNARSSAATLVNEATQTTIFTILSQSPGSITPGMITPLLSAAFAGDKHNLGRAWLIKHLGTVLVHCYKQPPSVKLMDMVEKMLRAGLEDKVKEVREASRRGFLVFEAICPPRASKMLNTLSKKTVEILKKERPESGVAPIAAAVRTLKDGSSSSRRLTTKPAPVRPSPSVPSNCRRPDSVASSSASRSSAPAVRRTI